MVLSHSYAELRGNNKICWIRGAVKDKVKVKTTELSRFFRSIDCKPPVWWCCWCGDHYESVIYDIATITHTSCRGRPRLLAIYMTSWSGPRDTLGYISPIPAFQFEF